MKVQLGDLLYDVACLSHVPRKIRVNEPKSCKTSRTRGESLRTNHALTWPNTRINGIMIQGRRIFVF